jgi:drug/metabolite transporter (DMT)-like permease
MLTRLAIATAPALFVLLWSTGFIGARYGMPYIEPLTFLAVRMGFAVVIMAAIALLAGARRPNANEIGHSLVAGSLVHGLTLGGVFTAISQGVPAGISALILGLQPIVTSALANRFMGEKITRLQSVGLALGLVGVLLVLHDRNIVLAGSVLGWVASFLSLIGITLGTLYQKRYCGGIDWRAGNLVQYVRRRSRCRQTLRDRAAQRPYHFRAQQQLPIRVNGEPSAWASALPAHSSTCCKHLVAQIVEHLFAR